MPREPRHRGRPVKKTPMSHTAIDSSGYIEKDGMMFENNEVMESYEESLETFARTMQPKLGNVSGYYDPFYANDIIKDINPDPRAPELRDLIRMLKNPQEYEEAMRGISYYLDGVVMQYKRSVRYLSSVMTLDYFVYPLPMREPLQQKDHKAYKENHYLTLEWLRKFRPKLQLKKVLEGVLLEDAKYYYIRESKQFIDLTVMPSDYCEISGDSSVGYRYAFDMLWFYQYGFTSELGFPSQHFAPEFAEWYGEFLTEWRKAGGNIKNYYQPMPLERSIVFKWDHTKAGIIPPLSGVFKDAVEIQEYKDILKAKMQLDTWKIIYQEIPLNDEGKPSIDAKVAGKFVSVVQNRLPAFTKTMASPMKPHVINFESAQTKDNITGYGENAFWDNIGIAKAMNGNSDLNSAGALEYTALADYGFMNHMLTQFENFINYQLSMATGRHKFGIKFIEGSTIYNRQKIQERTLADIQYGGSVSVWNASKGLEPYQAHGLEEMEIALGYKDIKPVSSSHTAGADSQDNGRPKKDSTDLEETGEVTRENGSNDDKI